MYIYMYVYINKQTLENLKISHLFIGGDKHKT